MSKGGRMMAGGGSSSNNGRKRPHRRLLLLVMALGAAVLCVVVLHKLRERRVFGLLLQDRERQLLTLQLLLKRERENSKEMKRKLGDMKTERISLKAQKMDFTDKLMETEATVVSLKEKQREIEIALEEKQNQINGLMDKEAESIKANLQVAALTELLKQKEAELEETKHRLMNLSPTENNSAEHNVISNGTVTDNGREDKLPQVGQLERPPNSSEGRTTMEERNADNPIELKGNQPVEIPKAGEWVKFKTNIDDEGLKHENQSANDRHGVEIAGDQQLEKQVHSQDSKHYGEGGEKGQESIVGVPKDEESYKLENPQYGNEGQVVPAGLKGTAKGEVPEMRAGHGSRAKTRRRRRRVVRQGRELEKRNDGQNFQNDETRRATGENKDNDTIEASKKGKIPSDGQSEVPENSQIAEGSVTEDGGGDKNPSDGKEQVVLPNEGRSEMIENFQAGKVSIMSMEKDEHDQVDDVTRSKHGTGDRNDLEDKEKDTKLEMHEGSQDEGSLGTGSQSISTVATETGAFSLDGQQGKFPNPEEAILQAHGGDGFNEIQHKVLEEGVKSTETQLEKPQDDKSDDNEGDAAMTKDKHSDIERQDQGVIKEAVTTNTISNPEETETRSTTNDHQSHVGTTEN